MLHILTPGRPVHSNAILTSLGSIQPHCNYCVVDEGADRNVNLLHTGDTKEADNPIDNIMCRG